MLNLFMLVLVSEFEKNVSSDGENPLDLFGIYCEEFR